MLVIVMYLFCSRGGEGIFCILSLLFMVCLNGFSMILWISLGLMMDLDKIIGIILFKWGRMRLGLLWVVEFKVVIVSCLIFMFVFWSMMSNILIRIVCRIVLNVLLFFGRVYWIVWIVILWIVVELFFRRVYCDS